MSALASLGGASPGAIVYREEIHHPALPEPEIATGTMRVDPDGSLVKAQEFPHGEVSAIGESFISVRRPPDAQPNLLPIPDDFVEAVEALKLLLSGEAARLAEIHSPELGTGPEGWQVLIALPGHPMRVLGCGDTLVGIELREPGGVRRLYTFTEAR